MRQTLISIISAIVLAGPGVAHINAATNSAVAAAPKEVLTVAIFDFESKEEGVRDMGPKVATLLNATLSANSDIITVERAELDKVLGEHELGLSGTVSEATAAKVGQITGAKVLVTGRVFKVDKETVIVAKVIGTETSRVYGETVQGAADTLVDMSSKLAAKISTDISTKGSNLVAKVLTPEERIAKIKQAFGSKPLPVVSIKISEQHYGPTVIDPAAQTELSLILQQCGFKLADGASNLKADIEITGEAFSARGLLKGNLISCKSRVELTVRDVATGNIRLVERQTSVGVDIAEQTAAKTALQNAAAAVAERILPTLVK